MVQRLRKGREDEDRMKPRSDPPMPEMAANIPSDTLKKWYIMMLKIRRFEEKLAEILIAGTEIRCPVHLYTGEEAVATGVCTDLRKSDYVFSTHRSHGHYLAKGGNLKALAAEIFGKATGCSGGRGGSMHLASTEYGLPGSSAIVAGTIPLAIGSALAFSLQEKDNVVAAFFGDGATNEGVFYESMNFASLYKVPIIFICENNFYSTHMPISSCLANVEIYRKAEIFNMPGIRIDGNNVREVFTTATKLIEDARKGRGPALMECLTYRLLGHVGPNDDLDQGLRSKEERDSWMDRCPIKRLEESMLENGALSEAEKMRIDGEIGKEVEEAITFARESPYPDEKDLLKNVFKT